MPQPVQGDNGPGSDPEADAVNSRRDRWWEQAAHWPRIS
jgi:hypothetical protein